MCASLRAAAQCTVLIITHKFREVMAYADDVTVLRRGQAVHHCQVADTHRRPAGRRHDGRSATPAEQPLRRSRCRDASRKRRQRRGPTAQSRCSRHAALAVEQLDAMGDRGTLAVQRRQPGRAARARSWAWPASRATASASWWRRWWASARGWRARVSVNGEPYGARREENRRLKVRSLPEEPLRNACVGDLSVAENMALRDFDQPPLASAAAGLPAEVSGLAQPRARVDRRVRRQDPGRGRADPQPLGRQRAARRAGARAGRRHQCADRGQPGVRAGLRGGGRNPRPHRAGARPRRRACCWSARTSTNCWSWPTASW